MSEPETKSLVKLHMIDISEPILNPSSLSSLAETCKAWGFFHITNHGISSDLYTKICSMSKDLFSLPLETKLKLGPSSPTKTYTPQFIASPFFESLRVNGPNFSASAQNSADILLHQNSSLFSEVLQEYGNKMAELAKKIMEILLMSLGHGFERKYESEFANCHGYLRINNYSPPHISHEDDDDDDDDHGPVEGLGMHTDMSCVTIVYQDSSGGLQVRSKDGQWMDISPCEGTLLVNVGDMLQAWSNEKLRSSEHRVVLRRSGGGGESSPRRRFSIAFFWCFGDDKVVLAPQDVVGPGSERAYSPFICLDYLKFRETDEKNKFEKVGFTVKDFAGVRKTGQVI